MSDYAIKVRVWVKGDDVRVYVNGRFCEGRSALSHVDAYLTAGADGAIRWNHAFRCGPDTIRRAEMCAMGVENFLAWIAAPNFPTLLTRIAECQTKQGNFSMRQYEAKYVLVAA